MSEKIDNEFKSRVGKLKNYRGAVSRLRKEITKLSALVEPACITLNRRLNGERVAADLVADAKWVMNTLQVYYETAIREENVKTKKKPPRKPSQHKEEAGTNTASTASVQEPASEEDFKKSVALSLTFEEEDDTMDDEF